MINLLNFVDVSLYDLYHTFIKEALLEWENNLQEVDGHTKYLTQLAVSPMEWEPWSESLESITLAIRPMEYDEG